MTKGSPMTYEQYGIRSRRFPIKGDFDLIGFRNATREHLNRNRKTRFAETDTSKTSWQLLITRQFLNRRPELFDLLSWHLTVYFQLDENSLTVRFDATSLLLAGIVYVIQPLPPKWIMNIENDIVHFLEEWI